MMNNGSMSDMLREAMERKEGSKDSFTMTGQYTSTVKTEEGPSGETREFVLYDSPNGEQIKVYGNWNEYAVSQDEEGNMMIADEDYPIVENKDGEYILDEATFEGQMRAEGVGREAEGGPGASKMEDIMEKLGQMENGGKIKDSKKRLTIGTTTMGTDMGGVEKPTFYADGEPVSYRDALNIYTSNYLKETAPPGVGAQAFRDFVQSGIMRSVAARKGMGQSSAERQSQREFREDRAKAGIEGLLRGLSKYNR